MQSGPHPAPMFKSKRDRRKPAATAVAAGADAGRGARAPRRSTASPRRRDAGAVAPPPAAHAGEARRAGRRARRAPRSSPTSSASSPAAASTTARSTASTVRRPTRAIRDFEHAAGLKASRRAERGAAAGDPARAGQGREAHRQRRRRRPAGAGRATIRSPTDRPAPSKRVIALQRALAEFGYGQIKPTGIDRCRDPGGDREIRARAQAAGHRPGLRPRRARARRDHRPAAGVSRQRNRYPSSRLCRMTETRCA